MHALHCANDLLVRVRLSFKHFCKLAKQKFTARDWSLVFDPENWTQLFQCISEHATTYKSPGSYSLSSLWKIRKRISQLSPFDHATWQHPRRNPRHVRGSARIYVVRMARSICSKNRKIVPYHRYAPQSLIMAPTFSSYLSVLAKTCSVNGYLSALRTANLVKMWRQLYALLFASFSKSHCLTGKRFIYKSWSI